MTTPEQLLHEAKGPVALLMFAAALIIGLVMIDRARIHALERASTNTDHSGSDSVAVERENIIVTGTILSTEPVDTGGDGEE